MAAEKFEVDFCSATKWLRFYACEYLLDEDQYVKSGQIYTTSKPEDNLEKP